MIRCFLAIYPIDNALQNDIEKIKKDIRKLIIGKEVEKENLHITISFLGELNEKELEEKKIKIEETIRKLKRTTATLNRIKLIPSEKFIRVIAIDVSGIDNIVKEVEKNVGGDVKPPHITLFRVKKIINKNVLLNFCKNFKLEKSFEIKDLKLIKSTLTRDGPVYSVLQTYNLL